MKIKYRGGVSLALGLIALTGNAKAQQDDAPSTTESAPGPVDNTATAQKTVPIAAQASDARSSATQNRFVEEVVVTAQKRRENIQDVPISINAFSAAALDAKGIEEPKALQLSTPGLQYDIFGGYSLIYIRGVGTDAFIPSADASVATYIDGVYYPFSLGLSSALGSVERVEILKGPQGTLFGRNSTGGAINIITRQPDDKSRTELQASRESYNSDHFRAYTNIPLTDTLAVSLAALSYDEDSYYRLSDRSPRNHQTPEFSRGFSPKLGWKPTDHFSVVIGFTYTHQSDGTFASFAARDVKPLGQALGVTQAPDFQTSEDAPVYNDTRTKVATADLKYQTSWFDLRLIGAYQHVRAPSSADFDGSSQPLASFSSPNPFAKVKTGEFQILSNDGSWAHDWLKYIAGVYYIDSSAGYDPLLFNVGANLTQFFANPPPTGLLADVGPLTRPLFSALAAALPGDTPLSSLLNDGVELKLRGVLDTQSVSGFTQATADLTDWMSLTLGGRYQVERRKLAQSSSSLVLNASNPDQSIPLFAFGNPSVKTNNFSPKAVLDFKPWDDQLLYLSYTKGFKSGTYNIISIYTPTQYIKPEVVTTFEAGVKSILFGRALRFNAALFQNQIRNVQVQTVSLLSGGAVKFETAGGARIRGADFDLDWLPLANALPGLVLSGGGAYLDGVYTDYQHGSGFGPNDGLFVTGLDFTGHRTVRTPKFSGNGELGYTFDFDHSALEFAGNVYYNSGSYFSAQNTKAASDSAYTVVNARTSYFYQPWGLRATVFGKNLQNTRHFAAIQDLDFATAKVLAPPITVGVKLDWQF